MLIPHYDLTFDVDYAVPQVDKYSNPGGGHSDLVTPCYLKRKVIHFHFWNGRFIYAFAGSDAHLGRIFRRHLVPILVHSDKNFSSSRYCYLGLSDEQFAEFAKLQEGTDVPKDVLISAADPKGRNLQFALWEGQAYRAKVPTASRVISSSQYDLWPLVADCAAETWSLERMQRELFTAGLDGKIPPKKPAKAAPVQREAEVQQKAPPPQPEPPEKKAEPQIGPAHERHAFALQQLLPKEQGKV